MSLAALALLLADGRMPNGAHAHSGGLEAAIAGGTGPAEIPAFMYGRLRTCAFVDASFAAAAARAGAAGRDEELDRLDLEAAARMASPELRSASAALGRSLLRSASRVLGAPALLEDYTRRSTLTPRSVVLGVTAAAAGLDPQDAATIALHEDLTGIASAAVKLLPVDTGACLAWVAELASDIEARARAAARVVDIAELPSLSAPALELRSLTHARTERRLFAT